MNVLNKNPATKIDKPLQFGQQAEFDQRLVPVKGFPDRSYAVLNNSFAIPGQNVESACPSNFLTVNGVQNTQTGKTYANFPAAKLLAPATSATLIAAFVIFALALVVAFAAWVLNIPVVMPYATPVTLLLVVIAIALFIKDRNDTL